jgi:hypothetical protein
MYDKRAREILINAFWQTSGWKREADRLVSPEDFAYAKAKRYMFDAVKFSHDELVSRLAEARETASITDVSNAFVASLGSRRLELRSALGSYAFALNFPIHQIAETPTLVSPSGARHCSWCGFYDFPRSKEIDLNVLNFERHKWGGVRHDDPVYAWLDLSLFRETEAQMPTSTDKHILQQILRTARSLEPDATAGSLEEALVGILKSSKAERRVLIEILAVCGVLLPKNRAGYFGEFTLACDREHTGQHFNDWGYPALWWRGADGVNDAALSQYFPDL